MRLPVFGLKRAPDDHLSHISRYASIPDYPLWYIICAKYDSPPDLTFPQLAKSRAERLL